MKDASEALEHIAWFSDSIDGEDDTKAHEEHTDDCERCLTPAIVCNNRIH